MYIHRDTLTVWSPTQHEDADAANQMYDAVITRQVLGFLDFIRGVVIN